MSKTYIHYGSSTFDKSLMNGITFGGPHSDKPGKIGTLWASPVDSINGWKDWCENEDYHTERLSESFRFNLSDKARILYVESEKDIAPYLVPFIYGEKWTHIDWEQVSRFFDGIEVSFEKNYNELRYGHFYTWDVDSIAVRNPEVILECK